MPCSAGHGRHCQRRAVQVIDWPAARLIVTEGLVAGDVVIADATGIADGQAVKVSALMLYALKIATRYLTASKAQTALLVFGVAIGVFIFIFMSALIGGPGRIHHGAHGGRHGPYHHSGRGGGSGPAVADRGADGPSGAGSASQATAVLKDTAAFMPLIEALPGVIGTSQQINGSGFLTRGAQVTQVSINGLEPGASRSSPSWRAISPKAPPTSGRARCCWARRWSRTWTLRLARRCGCKAQSGIEALLTITGIYEMGSGGPDRRQAYVSLATARTLFDHAAGGDAGRDQAGRPLRRRHARPRIKALTGLDAKSWTEQAAQLLEALKAQAQTGYILKAFALLTIIIGVASACCCPPTAAGRKSGSCGRWGRGAGS